MSISIESSAPKISAKWFRAVGNGISTFFSSLMEALHKSRRLQAAQIIRRYQFLLDEAERRPRERNARETESGAFAKMVTESPSVPRRLGVKAFISIAILGFGILHVIGWTMLNRAATGHPDQSAVHTAYGD